MSRRSSGILLHVTSLPSPFGIGDPGPEAFRFADFLEESGQSLWQVLPLNPTAPVHLNSPYSSKSAFAVSPLFLSPELLAGEGLIDKTDLDDRPVSPPDKVEYDKVIAFKQRLFEKAYQRFSQGGDKQDYKAFCASNADWLDDYSLFLAIKDGYGGRRWSDWPPELRDRRPGAMEEARRLHADRVEFEKFLQYKVNRQWLSLKSYCNRKGVQLIGDIPIYVNDDGADAWANPHLFKLDGAKKPIAVAGVPPDYFSATGQLWGNPVYDWEALRRSGYRWWHRRMEMLLSLFDAVRVDHFRGLVAYWEVPFGEQTAINGRWVEVPVVSFLNSLQKRFFNLPIIAEDLGVITPDVREIMDRYQFPGMRVLMFAFGSDDPLHPYLPHNYPRNSVVYTGTHDNNTARGWFENEADDGLKQRLFAYAGRPLEASQVAGEMMRLAMSSVADLAVFPLQDVLGLGQSARMNTPATRERNWEWRVEPDCLTADLVVSLRKLTRAYGRL